MQIPTQRYGRRPYGVGLLVAGYDVSSWCNLHQIVPVRESKYNSVFLVTESQYQVLLVIL